MKALSIILGVLMVIGGVFCVVDSAMTFAVLGWIIGFAAFIGGIGLICAYSRTHKYGTASGWTLFGGIVSTAIGLFILFSGRALFFTDTVLAYMISFWTVIFGIGNIVVAFKMKQLRKDLPLEKRGHIWLWALIIGILTTILGVYACIHPLVTIVTVGWLVGLSIIFTGIDTICLGIMMPGKRD